MPTFNIHITTPSPRLQHLSVSYSVDFPLQAAHSPLKNPTKPPAGLRLVLCKARPGPLRVLPAVETRLAPERDSLVQALPRQIWTQSEQRQRQLNWRRQARESRRRLQYPAQLAMDQEERPDLIDYPIQYTKRPADSGRTGRNLNPRGDSTPSRGVTRSANPHAKKL